MSKPEKQQVQGAQTVLRDAHAHVAAATGLLDTHLSETHPSETDKNVALAAEHLQAATSELLQLRQLLEQIVSVVYNGMRTNQTTAWVFQRVVDFTFGADAMPEITKLIKQEIDKLIVEIEKTMPDVARYLCKHIVYDNETGRFKYTGDDRFELHGERWFHKEDADES